MMNSTGMTALRQDAYSLLERIPEDKLAALVEIMRGIEGLAPKTRREENSEAFKRLQELVDSFPPVTDLDPEKELAEWREEKFGNAGAH